MSGRYTGFLALMLALCLLTATAFAGTSIGPGSTSAGSSDIAERLRSVPDFKFFHHKDGIGYGLCPVYTAPSEDAFRMSGGRASVSTDYELYEAGFDASGWLLVRYETNNGGVNVGYIPPRYVRGFKSNMSCKNFDYVPVSAGNTIRITNNPLLKGSAFATMDPGEEFHVLAKYTYHGDWWYIECMVDGQVARGFIDRESSQIVPGGQGSSSGAVDIHTLGNPDESPLGTRQIGSVRVDYGTNGSRQIVHTQPATDSDLVFLASVNSRFPCYAAQKDSNGRQWYYIWVEEISKWGWISGNISFIQ